MANKAREQAETAFGKTQTEFLARSRSISEVEAVTNARDEKTARLKELRKEKEAAERALQADQPAKPGKR